MQFLAALYTSFKSSRSDKNRISKFYPKFDLSDVVSLHIPYSSENQHIIGKEELALLKKDAKLVNTSRGGLIDEKALISFLNENNQASAYIDTFEEEPYSGELINLENILLTPHIGSYAKEVRINMELESAQKIIEFFK